MTKLNAKLNAILAKNLDDIVAKGVHLPFVADGYTKADLNTWLKKRSDLLADAKINNYNDTQINTFITNQRNTLSVADKVIADAIIAGTFFDLGAASDSVAYEKLVILVLYKFVTS